MLCGEGGRLELFNIPDGLSGYKLFSVAAVEHAKAEGSPQTRNLQLRTHTGVAFNSTTDYTQPLNRRDDPSHQQSAWSAQLSYNKIIMATSQSSGVEEAVDGGSTAGLKHAVYVQKKLEGMYKRTYKLLAPRREWIEQMEEVLVWNKPMVSAFVYFLVHWVFM